MFEAVGDFAHLVHCVDSLLEGLAVFDEDFERVVGFAELGKEHGNVLDARGERVVAVGFGRGKRGGGRRELAEVFDYRGQDYRLGDVERERGFDLDFLGVLLDEDFVARVHFACVEHAVFFEEFYVLFFD